MNILGDAGLPTWFEAERRERSIFEGGLGVQRFDPLRVRYPRSVIDALVSLYDQFNVAFAPMVAAHREWESDYAPCTGPDGAITHWIVQIDMVGLGDGALDALRFLPTAEVRETLRERIFEIENSWAAYRTHARSIPEDDGPSYPTLSLRVLDGLRERFGRPVALVADTAEKAQAMLEAEFGRAAGEWPEPEEVRRTTGFDAFFGPDELGRRLADGPSEHLLYVRASDPVDALRAETVRPSPRRPLLEDATTRRRLREAALTPNIDAPHWTPDDPRRMNDTKHYLPAMGMGQLIEREEDLARACERYGDVRLRLKPAQGSYGCYGHLSGHRSDKRFRYAVRQGLRRWNRFVAQPEREASVAVNRRDDVEYEFMDRVFCGIVDGRPAFLGGHRLFLERASAEARRRRLHIVRDTVFAEIAAVGAR